jgi:preprotein translocase subunit SecA
MVIERTAALYQYGPLFFRDIREELSQAQEPKRKENIYQRIETVASETFCVLEETFQLFAGHLGEKKDGKFDFQLAYRRFLELARTFVPQEKELP